MVNKPKIKLKKPEVEETFVGDDEGVFSDRLDLLKHALEIHHKESNLPNDYVLFRSDDDDKKFFREMHRIAFATREFIADKEQANKIANLLVTETVIVAAMKRNDYENAILSGLFATPADDEGSDLINVDAIKKRIGLGGAPQ